MIDHIVELRQHYRTFPLLIDTNLLILLLLGRVDRNQIEKFKRTTKFTINDYLLLERFIEPFDRVATTPNILTEVSNLSGQLNDPLRTRYFRYLIDEIENFVEIYFPSAEVARSEIFIPLGLTDASIRMVAEREKILVLTEDLTLYSRLISSERDAVNFNHWIEYNS